MTEILRNPQKQAVREEGTRPGPVYRPDADILERADEYLVLVDVPVRQLPGDDGDALLDPAHGVAPREAHLHALPAADPAWPLRPALRPQVRARALDLADDIFEGAALFGGLEHGLSPSPGPNCADLASACSPWRPTRRTMVSRERGAVKRFGSNG